MNLENLRKIGLSPYESQCYATLVKYGTLSGKEIAKLSKVPPTSVYRNLESLEKKEIIKLLQKEPLTYQVIDPEIALKEYIEKQKELLEKDTEESIQYLKNIKNTGAITPKKEVLFITTGKKQVYSLGISLVKKAEKEMLLIGRGEKPNIYSLSQELQKASERGVIVKFITTAYEENKEVYQQLKKKGVSVKQFNTNITMLVRDEKESEIVIKTPHLKEERTGIHIIDENFAKTNAEYFQTLWKKATPI